MDALLLVARFRRFLLVAAGALCLGTIAELVLAEHYADAIQLVPFGLCAIALLGIGAALLRPTRPLLLALRAATTLLIAGSLFGIYEHLTANLAFELEIRPGATASAVLVETLKGAAPLLAPGMLALAGVLALAATYYHPALQRTAATITAAADKPHRA